MSWIVIIVGWYCMGAAAAFLAAVVMPHPDSTATSAYNQQDYPERAGGIIVVGILGPIGLLIVCVYLLISFVRWFMPTPTPPQDSYVGVVSLADYRHAPTC